MNNQDEQQLEIDALDNGATPREVLMRRVHRAQVEKDQALEELGAVMSDAEALEEYGINIDKA